MEIEMKKKRSSKTHLYVIISELNDPPTKRKRADVSLDSFNVDPDEWSQDELDDILEKELLEGFQSE